MVGGSYVSIRSDMALSPTSTSAVWSASGVLCRMLPILLCIFTGLSFSHKLLQGPTCAGLFLSPYLLPTVVSVMVLQA